MTDPNAPGPTTLPEIWVPSSSIAGNAMTLLRDVAKVAATSLAGHGLITADQTQTVEGIILLAVPVLWSQYVSWRKDRKMRIMEPHTPADVAQLK